MLQRAVASAAKTLGEQATYTTQEGQSKSLRALMDRDVFSPIQGMDSSMFERRTVISIEAAAIAGYVPTKGDRISIGAEAWRVVAIEQDDGYLIRLKVVGLPL